MTNFKRQRQKHVKKPYRVRNWGEYEAGLWNRGSLTTWLEVDTVSGTIPGWNAPDSRGLRVHVGLMRKPPKNRDYRKLHFGVDERTGEVIAVNLTSKSATDASRVPSLLRQVDRPIASVRADAQYDAKKVYEAVESLRDGRSPRVLIPPKKNARIKPKSSAWRERNRNIRGRARLGKRRWSASSGYNMRSKGETAFSRYKRSIGPAMRARDLAAQRVEVRIGAQILNRMTAFGMPDSYMVG